MPNDPYDALGLAPSATAEEIKSAYRKLARKNHPDQHPDDPTAESRFKAITAAYGLLKDPETRARFDAGEIDGVGAERPRRRRAPDFAHAAGPAHGFGDTTGFGPDYGRDAGAGFDPADVFADILRRREGASGDFSRGFSGDPFGDTGFSAPGHDLRYALEVTFLDAARGAETRITLPDGQSLALRIPPGTEDGRTLRLRGKGDPGFGSGPDGDALIAVAVRPHPVFRRDGDDILLTLPITIDEAILGAKVTTPTIDGPVGLTIPPGASSGRILRLRGRGVARKGKATRGDQKVELRIVAPPEPDESLRAFMTEWRKTHAHDPRADLSTAARL